jgi:hypothetical protein
MNTDELVQVILESTNAYSSGAIDAADMAERIAKAVRRRDGQQGGRPAQTSMTPGLFTKTLAEFCQAYLSIRGVPYIPTVADRAQLKASLKFTKSTPLRAAFEAYLRDQDPFLAKVGYSLKFFCTNGLNKYRMLAAQTGGPMDAIVSENFRTKGYGA